MAPPASTPAPLRLICTTTSLRNVTIASPSDEYYYEVVTVDWEPLITKIRRLDTETGKMSLVAELKKEEAHSRYTGLRFINPEKEENEFVALEAFWLADAGGKVLGSFTGEDGRQYQWRESKRSVELVRADEPEGKTLARLHKHHRHLGVLRMSEKPFLDVDTELAASMDAFIVSFLLAEGKRRA